MTVEPTIEITAYHGTYLENSQSIIENGFRESLNHNKWYGDGTYFFIPGLSNPIDSAKQYALDNRTKERGEMCNDEICVMEAQINVETGKLLDLTQVDGIQLFNYFKQEVTLKVLESGKKPTKVIQDHHLLNLMRKELDVEFVKGPVYIQFGIQRQENLTSKIPNCTIFVVNNPLKHIDKQSIKKIA